MTGPGNDGGMAVPPVQVAMPQVIPMNNPVVSIAGGGATVVNGLLGAQIIFPTAVWIIVFGAPVGVGPLGGAARYDIVSPTVISGNLAFLAQLDAANVYLFG